jgi:hypothetical protein
MTIDFSKRIESGVNAIFPDVIIQKCIFHAIQLFTRGLIKELTRVKNERLLAHIKEWNQLRKVSIALEKSQMIESKLNFKFKDTAHAWKVYQELRSCIINKKWREIEQKLSFLLLNPLFMNWKGKQVFLQKYEDIFTKRKFKFSDKSMKYVVPKIYKAWRGAVRELRFELELIKTKFNTIKYLILMNPQNMKPYHGKKLQKYLKIFPWLRSYRKIIVRFYYQFRLTTPKKSGFKFLTQLLSENSHRWLKAAISTLIENEENIFQFKNIYNSNPTIKSAKSIKVVNESSNRVLHQLFQTQYGMRTIENIRMRVSYRLKCPIFISPSLLETVN